MALFTQCLYNTAAAIGFIFAKLNRPIQRRFHLFVMGIPFPLSQHICSLLSCLGFTWVATTQSDAIKQRSCRLCRLRCPPSEGASPKDTPLCMYNMSLFLLACLLHKWQRASSAGCLLKKSRGLTTPRSSKSSFPDNSDVIVTEIEVSQRCALTQHPCKTLCPGCSNVIVVETEVSQRSAIRQRSCKILCPSCFNVIAAEVEVSQRSALRQHSC